MRKGNEYHGGNRGARSSQRPQAAYVIVHFNAPNGQRQVLLGKEAVISPKALSIFKSHLRRAGKNQETKTQFKEIFDLIVSEQITAVNGALQLQHKQPWAPGRNLSGILLIGRAALAGGHIERNESAKNAALRELIEEYGIDDSLLTPEVKNKLRTQLKEVHRCSYTTVKNKNRTEVFYSLDLDALTPLQEGLTAANLIAHFDSLKTSSVSELWGKRITKKQLFLDKRKLFVIDAEKLANYFQSGMDEEDKVVNHREIGCLCQLICDELNKLFDPVNCSAKPDFLVKKLLEHQESRLIDTHLEAAKKFLTYLGVKTSLSAMHRLHIATVGHGTNPAPATNEAGSSDAPRAGSKR